jgi:hypothetical protein
VESRAKPLPKMPRPACSPIPARVRESNGDRPLVEGQSANNDPRCTPARHSYFAPVTSTSKPMAQINSFRDVSVTNAGSNSISTFDFG